MRVKIIGVQFRTYWYSSKIGEIFEVDDENYSGCYQVKSNGFYIDEDDCIIISDDINRIEIE